MNVCCWLVIMKIAFSRIVWFPESDLFMFWAKWNILPKTRRAKLIALFCGAHFDRKQMLLFQVRLFSIFLTENFIKNSMMTFLHVSTWFFDYIILIIVSFNYYATQTL